MSMQPTDADVRRERDALRIELEQITADRDRWRNEALDALERFRDVAVLARRVLEGKEVTDDK